MFFVHPSAGDRFFLRLLLIIVPGPTSFEDLRTHEGIVYPTFRGACGVPGLTEDVLTDAIRCMMPQKLRGLFAILWSIASSWAPSLFGSNSSEISAKTSSIAAVNASGTPSSTLTTFHTHQGGR